MEKEPIIVRIPDKPKSFKFYLHKELSDDINVFPKNIHPLVEKFINGEQQSSHEQSLLDRAINKWWLDKYGFSFTSTTARNEVLQRKYDPQKSKEAHALQWDLLQAIKESNEEKIEQLKKSYQEEYPDQMETIEVIFGIRDFLEKAIQITDERKTSKEKISKNKFRDLTEYQFLFTHFLVQNNKNREFLDLFWNVATEIAEKMNAKIKLDILRRGQISQVAVYRIVQELGQNPKLAHPDEDAFEAIDLWESADKAIQIKGWEEEVPAVFNVDEIVFPAMQVDNGKHKKSLYNSAEHFQSKNTIFRAKLKEYGERLGKEFSGYMLAVPYSKIDFINGEPAPELIEFFRDKLGTKTTAN